MTLEDFAKENAISLQYELSQLVVSVTFKDSYVKDSKFPSLLQRCVGEGRDEDEALHNYTYKIRGKKLVVNHSDHDIRKDITVPLSLNHKGTF